MSAMSDAVKNGPRAVSAKTAQVEARIVLADAKASALQQSANNHARKAKGDGPIAKYHRGQAAALATAAERRRSEANDLRVDLAKAKADEAARNVKHVKRTAGSTAAEGLVPKASDQVGPAKAGQVAKPADQRAAGGFPKCPVCPHNLLQHNAKGCIKCKCKTQVRTTERTPEPPTKGTNAMTVSGEAVNIEQTRANLDQLKSQVTDVRGSFEATSGSLASGGLNQLAGSLASADDALDSVLTQIEAAEKHLSDQEAIAEAAQAAGEMHGDKSFYGA